MASVARIDHMSTLEAEERFGVLQRLTRVAHVSGLESTDYRVLFEALANLDLPDNNDKLPGDDNLILTGRSVKVIDKTKCEVVLTYGHFNNEGQNPSFPFIEGQIAGEIRANVQQITTNKDNEGNTVSVQYAYPSDYKHDDGVQGETVTQGGEMQVYVPQQTLTIPFISSMNPNSIMFDLCGSVNSTTWCGGVARTWMCTAVAWKPHGISSGVPTWFFNLEFQYNKDTWDPWAVFIDPYTGKPPPDLTTDGKKQVEWHPAKDFFSYLTANVMGMPA